MKRTRHRIDDAEAGAATDRGSADDVLDLQADAEAAESRSVDLTPGEARRRRGAELRSEGSAIDGEGLSDQDFYTLNGGGPTAHLQRAIWKLPGMTERQIDALDRQQRKSYDGFAPENEMARMRARMMIVLETVATGSFQKAAHPDADLAETRAYVDLGLRCIEGLNKISDRFERARGQAQQQIFVQHNRFDPGSQAVLQNVQTDRIESSSGKLPLLNGPKNQRDGGASAVLDQEPSPPPRPRQRSARTL